ncbi:unnamed protein product, partial [Clonostachys rosea f. rosea IK726]
MRADLLFPQKVYSALCPGRAFPKPRLAVVRSLYDPSASTPGHVTGLLDAQALVLSFPGPNSVTGEDVLELHIHGGPATVKAVLAAIPRSGSSRAHRIRYAEPGEFTKRAFIHDRLDLAQVESLGDTLAAETEQQRRAAVRGNSGALGRTYEDWREKLLLARGEIEALIDFSEDQHFDDSQSELLSNVTSQVADILRGIGLHEQGSQRSELLRSGIRIALVGPPNVGKSSLMNLIVGREASIVSSEAGTTRDIVEASLDIRGYLCSFADTAGFRSRESTSHHEGLSSGPIGPVEEEGIRRAKQKALDSDIVVVFASIEKGPAGNFLFYDEETLDLAANAKSSIIVINKIDGVDESRKTELIDEFRQALAVKSAKLSETKILAISCRDAQSAAITSNNDPGGVHSVTNALVSVFSQMTEMPVELQDLLGVTERQRQLLAECRRHLESFAEEAQAHRDDDADVDVDVGTDVVLAAEYLRYAADCLARITGRGEAGDVEDVLGVVFEK